TTTRGMLFTVLHRMSGKVSTVQSKPWYTDAVSWVMTEGISDGTAPERDLSRQEMATLFYRYAQATGCNITPADLALTFVDGQEIDAYATEAIRYCVSRGFMQGKDGNRFDPHGMTKRVELSAVLHRFLERPAK
ncbi:MAG: S-layer homology domain-containing protein, partial [Oscillospiraceae bacterium]